MRAQLAALEVDERAAALAVRAIARRWPWASLARMVWGLALDGELAPRDP